MRYNYKLILPEIGMKKSGLSFAGKVKSLIIAALIMIVGMVLFKYVLMEIWGLDILYDASLHLTGTIFVLYVVWYFIDRNETWRIPYFVFAGIVIAVVSIQRIVANAHNDFGLLLALVVSFIAIVVSRRDYFKDKFRF